MASEPEPLGFRELILRRWRSLILEKRSGLVGDLCDQVWVLPSLSAWGAPSCHGAGGRKGTVGPWEGLWTQPQWHSLVEVTSR